MRDLGTQVNADTIVGGLAQPSASIDNQQFAFATPYGRLQAIQFLLPVYKLHKREDL